MQSVTCKPFMLSFVVLSAVMPKLTLVIVIMLTVMVPVH